ncbi:hypothetical protein VQ044_15150 [Aurantimonas sp. C2-5-R2]|uniref:hypothetical protein n=1 Tax=Aurantimonas sp. C2-5-R2 TaxID=3113713 RepID=UPI002F94FE99
MKKNNDFDALFPGVVADVDRMIAGLIDNDASATGLGLALIVCGSELLTVTNGAGAAIGALEGARDTIAHHVAARLMAAA